MQTLEDYTNIRDSYELYESTSENPVSKKKYLKITQLYCKLLMKKIIDEGQSVVLPSRMGVLYIGGRKNNIKRNDEGEIINLPVDWKKTKELWEKDPIAKRNKKRIFFTNDHTDGYVYKVRWSKKDVIVKNKTLYYFYPTDTNKKRMGKAIKNEGVEYINKN